MALVSIRDLSIGFRGPALLENVSCQIESNQRIGLLGRNGAGKTTLMRLIKGEEQPDAGSITVPTGTRIAFLSQDVPRASDNFVYEVVSDAYEQHDIDDEDSGDWRRKQNVERVLSDMQLDPQAIMSTLSSGMKRRVLLAKCLVNRPDLLLLDEPTNHLDVDSIEWLEKYLQRFDGTLIFVTHDRAFLRNVATRILEIDRGKLFDWSCDYDTFLARKEDALAAEEKQEALFDKKLAQEEAWIRQGIKARRTRNEGRVRALKKLREERRNRREKVGQVDLRVQEGERSGMLVAEAKSISFAYTEQPIVDGFSTMILRGDKIGIVGPNGAGKTTLLKLLLGELPPERGSVRLGTNLQIAYFDQLRDQLNDEKTVQENVGDGYENVQAGGRPMHVIGYLQGFLFSPERARTPVRFLSGGERNRVLLARLFAKPANTIVLDEPTNDLDAETLELLEQRLVEFSGTILMVSHDREFLNNVVTSTIVFEDGKVREYIGGYDDWIRQRPSGVGKETAKPAKKKRASVKTTEAGSRKRLSYREQQELASLPSQIEQLEEQIESLHQLMASPDFYQQNGEIIASEQKNLKSLEDKLADSYERWEELEGRKR